METVIFDGVAYTKASVLSKRFAYTADYLGQLCRGNKVDARLVGRAWYINVDSLEKHRQERYKASTLKSQGTGNSNQAVPVIPKKHYTSRIDVEPILKKKAVRILQADRRGIVGERFVRYEGDDYSLIPAVTKLSPATSLPVLPAEAERLKVTTGPKHSSFKPEALPEVYLKGTLRVEGLAEASEATLDDETELPSVLSLGSPQSNEVLTEATRLPDKPKPMLRRRILKTAGGSRDIHKNIVISEVSNQVVTGKKIPITSSGSRKIRQNSVVEEKFPTQQPLAQIKPVIPLRPVTFKPKVVQQREVVPARVTPRRGLFWLVCVIGFFCTLGVFSLRLDVTTTESTYRDEFVFEPNNLVQFFARAKELFYTQ